MAHAPALEAYIDLMVRCLTNTIYKDGATRRGKPRDFREDKRADGRDWPLAAHTMIGTKRMRSLADQVVDVIQNDVPGDMIETGVWRGGSCAMMRGICKALGAEGRTVYVADSFEGLPPPDPDAFPADKGDKLYSYEELAIGLDEVKATFAAYGLLDDQVQFVKGWFKDTLHLIEAQRFSIVRLDGDMYESTIQGIEALYPKLQKGGYLVVDDYGAVPACKQAIHDYRDAHGITEEIHEIDWTGVYWKRESAPA